MILCVAPMGIFWLSYKRKEDRSTGMEKVHKHAAKSEKKIYLICLTQTTDGLLADNKTLLQSTGQNSP